jgi:multisubunit Na+/H+ antiporter MnhC subunit
MPIVDALIATAIAIAFIIFAAVLAWAERQTRHSGQPAQQSTASP